MAEKRESEALKRDKLFDYWEQIPLVNQVDMSHEEVFTHKVRDLIVFHLRKGIEGVKSDGVTDIRHAFSAKEILDFVNTELKEKMKLQSLYFHLQKLQEYGLIETISTLHEGRHNIAYFGRTARGFAFETTKKDQDRYKLLFNEANKFANAIGKKIPEDTFQKYLKEYNSNKKEIEEHISNWLKENEKVINESNIDAAYMFSFLKRISVHNNRMATLLDEMAGLLNYKNPK